ncbi:hypothetical protein ACNO6Y_09225 [Vibrio owensii]|uniref:hypothetical protein n=1 Tax=Vibrio owensii TaxID=696485 RepID=UPI003AAB801E
MDNSAALLLKCCEHIERNTLGHGQGLYTLLSSRNEGVLKKLDELTNLLLRAREYIFLGLYTQARRVIAIMQVLSEQVKREVITLTA